MNETKFKSKSVIFYAIAILCLALGFISLLITFTVYLKETIYFIPTGGSRTELSTDRDWYYKNFFDYVSYLDAKGWEPSTEIIFIVSLALAFAVSVFLTVFTLVKIKKNSSASKALKIILLALSAVALLPCVMSIILQADATTWKVCSSKTQYITGGRLLDQFSVCGSVMLVPVIILSFAAFVLQLLTAISNLKTVAEPMYIAQQNDNVVNNLIENTYIPQTEPTPHPTTQFAPQPNPQPIPQTPPQFNPQPNPQPNFQPKPTIVEPTTIKNSNNIKAESDNLRAVSESIGLIFQINGVRGRSISVYKDRCVIKVKASFGSFITGNITDGEKTIYYSDCIGVQFKEAGVLIGYLQLETASATMNQKGDNFFNENSFTFDLSTTTNEIMRDVRDYIEGQIRDIKNERRATPSPAAFSIPDELKKYKELLDMGILTQEEFDAKKKQLLNL